MKVVIIGSGKTLFFLCRSFNAKGYEVVVINRDPHECVKLARQLDAVVVCGDASDTNILHEAGALGADALIAITPNDQDNLIICQLAALKFGVPRVMAQAHDPENAEVFEQLGVSAFSTTQLVSSLIEQLTATEQITNLMPVGEGRVNVTEVMLEAGSPWEGKSLKEVLLPENALIAVILREGRPTVPRGGSRLLAGDRLVVITLPENHGAVIKALTGEQD